MRSGALNSTRDATETNLNSARPARRGASVPSPPVRVLVIEDDDAIRSVLDRGLRAEGFEVETCADGSTGLWRALDGGHAAIVLDLLLPGKNGYQVCEAIRREGVTTPILVLTAKSGEDDQIDLLDLGADDFLTKPSSLAVIAARLRVLIRRSRDISHNRIERGALVYDLATRACVVEGIDVVLTNREDQVLRRLLLAGGACVSRQELLEEVWGVDSGTEPSIVDIYLRRLRAKVAPVEIGNVRGLGYRIADR